MAASAKFQTNLRPQRALAAEGNRKSRDDDLVPALANDSARDGEY